MSPLARLACWFRGHQWEDRWPGARASVSGCRRCHAERPCYAHPGWDLRATDPVGAILEMLERAP